jgi:hypothetical protein
MSTQSMFFPLVNALIVDVRRVVVAGTDCFQLSPHDAECRAEPRARYVKPFFAGLSAAVTHRVAKRTEYSSAF